MERDESARKEIQFEWSHFSILTTDSKVRSTFQDSIFPFERERVKCRPGLHHKKLSCYFKIGRLCRSARSDLCFKED